MAVPTIETLLKVWSAIAGPAAPRAWVSARLDDAAAITQIAFSTMTDTVSSVAPYRYRKLRQRPDPARFDLVAMVAALERHLSESRISEEAKMDVEQFIEAARHFLEDGAVPNNDLNMDD
jgi:hypothetical protein